MDRSLWLLVELRSKAWVRRWVRNLRTLKGILFAIVGGLCFLPMFAWAFLMPRLQIEHQTEQIQRFGPIGLFGYCILNILLSSGERAVYYIPAEVDFLFCGPYRPRQLLLYRVAANLAPALFSTAFMTLVFRLHAALTVSAFVGLFLALEMMFLLSMAVSLFASLVGALAFNRQRKLLLVVLAAVVVSALIPVGREAFALGPTELLRRIENAPLMQAIVTPFRPFVMAFTADRIWPDLVREAALASVVDLALLGLVLGLNLQFLEVSAVASARRYERLQRARRGAMVSDAGTSRVRILVLPWWGGIGPNLWRQLTTAARSTSRVVAVWFLFVVPLLMQFLFSEHGSKAEENPAVLPLILLGSLAIFAPTMVGYDFRPDLERMEDLKTLPIPPLSLAIGQLVTPVLVITVGEWLGLAIIAAHVDLPRMLALAIVVVAPALNFLLVGIENLYCLWFPTRFVPGSAADFQTMGRQFLLMMARILSAGVVGGIAVGLGVLVYTLTGENWPLAILAAWLTLATAGLALVPAIAKAFLAFDVASDHVE